MSEPAERVLLAAQTQAAYADDPTTNSILDAALEQFEAVGIAKSTVEDISRRAKVARVTVYRRFGGKDAVVEAVLLRELKRFQERLAEATSSFSDPEDQLAEGFAFTVETFRSHRLLQRLLETEPEQILPHLTTQGARFLELGRGFLAARMVVELEDGRSMEEMLVAADVASRLVISFAITPGAVIDLDSPEEVRQFAHDYLGPVLRRPT